MTEKVELIQGDCLEKMRSMKENSVDAIITDPPYELGFMGKKWDSTGIANNKEMWAEALRVLKPGGHLLSFSGTRTYHRMACAIEDAGFEVRDMIEWVYGSGFPKSLNIGKAIDRQRKEDIKPSAVVSKWLNSFMPDGWNMNNWRKYLNKNIIGVEHGGGSAQGWTTITTEDSVKPRVATVEQWVKIKELLSLPDDMDLEVWRLNGNKGQPGEVFKKREVVEIKRVQRTSNSWETTKGMLAVGEQNFDITKGTSEYEGWGTALKPAHEPICMARKPLAEKTVAENCLKWGTGGINIDASRVGTEKITIRGGGGGEGTGWGKKEEINEERTGRFPANLILSADEDGQVSEEVRECFPETGKSTGGRIGNKGSALNMMGQDYEAGDPGYGDSGNASRFFKSIIYKSKASKKDRGVGNNHPTVKSVALMEYLIKMVTTKGGTVLDPFMGSGSTGVACMQTGRAFIGIEMDAEYCLIAEKRLNESFEKKTGEEDEIYS